MSEVAIGGRFSGLHLAMLHLCRKAQDIGTHLSTKLNHSRFNKKKQAEDIAFGTSVGSHLSRKILHSCWYFFEIMWQEGVRGLDLPPTLNLCYIFGMCVPQ